MFNIIIIIIIYAIVIVIVMIDVFSHLLFSKEMVNDLYFLFC